MWGGHHPPTCLASSLMISLFDWSSVAWVGCVAHYMHRCRAHAS